MHEEVLVNGPVGFLQHPLDHYSYDSVSDYLARQDRYARLAAQEMLREGRQPRAGELFWRPCSHFLKLYVLRLGHGRIINMSSISGKFVYPFFGAYAASKHALEAFTDALRRQHDLSQFCRFSQK